MGLLDTLLVGRATEDNPLRDWLRTSLMQQQQYQPGPGFAPVAASPLDVGGYQMPRIGNAEQYTPDPAALPVNAQSAQGYAIPGQPMPGAGPMPAAPRAPFPTNSSEIAGFFDRLNSGLQSIGNGGSVLGALTGNFTDKQSVERRAQLPVVQWLQNRGHDVATIQAAFAQPELMKALIEESKPKNPLSLGDGYIWDPKSNRAVRAYEPEKAPTTLGEGWIWDPQQKKAVRVYEPEAKPPTSVQEYTYYRQNLPPGVTPMGYDAWSTAKARAGAVNITNAPDFGGGSDKQIFDSFAENTKEARATATGLNALRTARQSLQGPGGAITGFGADERLTLQKLGAAIGVVDPSKIQNTETFRAAIAPQVSAVLKSTVGTANISNSDREFAEKAAGGSIKLDAGSIFRLLDIMERAAKARLDLHQEQLDAVYPDPVKHKRERALFGVRVPAAENSNIDDLLTKYGSR